jgi:hypothetical protein
MLDLVLSPDVLSVKGGMIVLSVFYCDRVNRVSRSGKGVLIVD